MAKGVVNEQQATVYKQLNYFTKSLPGVIIKNVK